MARDGLKILDSDMHLMEPVDLWERYMDSQFRSEAPRGLTSENVRDLRMAHPDGRLWGLPQTMENGTPIRAQLSQEPGNLRLPLQIADGQRKFNLKLWISRESTSPYSILHEAFKYWLNRTWNLSSRRRWPAPTTIGFAISAKRTDRLLGAGMVSPSTSMRQ